MTIALRATAIALCLFTANLRALAQNRLHLADIKWADPTIIVELRYETSNNIAGRRIYPKGMPALVRPELLPRLRSAQKFLRQFDYRLKIWDAYRPPSAQQELWRAVQNENYVANPDLAAGSLHSWGVAVDCTLADLHGHSLVMPTDFDDFTPAAMSQYSGPNRAIRSHLRLLRVAMAGAGFYGYHNEWWHFTAKDWPKYLPPAEAERVVRVFGSPSKSDL
jgi:D-alanyl-D-alanine dipeptidase